MEAFDHRLNTFFGSWLGPRDQRVRGWLLLDNYYPTFTLTLVYLVVVWTGPKYMRHRQPYSCRGLLVFYNAGQTLLSLCMFYQLVAAVWQGSYDFYCQDTHSSQEADDKIMNVLWWYYFSKFIEFMDTVFFILRKNNHQITFLHVYHHATMFNIWWFVMNWLPCGHTYFGPCLNSFVHTVMYSYYGLSAIPSIRPYLWWKKYITQLQLVQFLLTVLQTMCAVIWPCGLPLGWLYFEISYMLSLVFFFSNFYYQTYKKHKWDNEAGSSLSKNRHTNRTPSQEHNAHNKDKLRMD
ncbi:elongation of very long chain fatty acids protein 5 isoform X1 [Entelurus aequoreus]|uniref:elongation of very long chain fatty acids protein 5 isoform X1 n=1 Tax=Entelurus aequoreus TaxID=161455 RepID=UPI002B1D6B90|nr:elongation of very long chain fatty acids protein 5 isoform X1 [Entelurus aequoreus]